MKKILLFISMWMRYLCQSPNKSFPIWVWPVSEGVRGVCWFYSQQLLSLLLSVVSILCCCFVLFAYHLWFGGGFFMVLLLMVLVLLISAFIQFIFSCLSLYSFGLFTCTFYKTGKKCLNYLGTYWSLKFLFI